MPIVLQAADGNQHSAQQGRERNKDNDEARSVTTAALAGAADKDPEMPREEEREETKTCEREATVTAREAAPTIVESVVFSLRAHGDADERGGRGTFTGLAAGNKVGPGSADGVFKNISQKCGHGEGDQEREDR